MVSDDIRPDVSEILEMKEMPKVQLLSGQEQNCPEAPKKYPKKRKCATPRNENREKEHPF